MERLAWCGSWRTPIHAKPGRGDYNTVRPRQRHIASVNSQQQGPSPKSDDSSALHDDVLGTDTGFPCEMGIALNARTIQSRLLRIKWGRCSAVSCGRMQAFLELQ